MKILFYGINYSPELTGIGKYTGEMAEWFAARGHEVRVITAPPYYPEWKVKEGYSNHYHIEKLNGVTVYRIPLWVPSQPGGLKRLVHLASFAICSLPKLFMQWRWKPDVIWVVEPPLMCAPAAVAFAKLNGAKSWLHIQDYEVDAAFDMGLIKGKLLRRIVENIESWLMRCFNRVSTISGQMLQLASKKGVVQEKIISFPNWVDISAIQPLNRPSSYRKELEISENAVVALYSGNMGGKQGLEILAQTAKLIANTEYSEQIEFVFCGHGAGRAELEEACKTLSNVRFLDLQPFERLSDLLGLADIHLLPQRADAADLVMPSKLTGMMASGRAVVATATPDTELGRVVAQETQCGLIVQPENAQAVVDAVLKLTNDEKLREKLGENGRLYAEKSLNKDQILKNFEEQLFMLKKLK